MTTPDFAALAAQINYGRAGNRYPAYTQYDLETALLACYAALQAAQAETQRAVEAGKHK